MGGVQINKDIIRKELITKRKNMKKEEVAVKSDIIAEKLEQLACMTNVKSIMCYVSFENEILTHSLIRKWLFEGKQVSVPCIAGNLTDRLMYAVKIEKFEELRACGKFGILEPTLKESNIVKPEELEIIIVPGSVFDIKKNRIGYGAGFYDSFMGKVKNNCIKVGVGYDFQVLESIPTEEHDIPLDILITEERIL